MRSDVLYWEKRGETYGKLDDVRSKRTAYQIVDMIKPLGINAGSWILDTGCGRGDITCVLRNNFRHSNVLGIDLSQRMIDGANRYRSPGLRFLQADAFDFLKDLVGVFDLTVMSLFLHHLTEGRDKKMLNKVYEATKKNGHILIAEAVPPDESIFNLYRDIFKLKEDRNCYSLAMLLKMLYGAGFVNVKFKTYRFDIRLLSWLNDHTLSDERKTLLYRMHTEAPKVFKDAYAMDQIGSNDYRLRCKMAVITGTRN